jgi:hypothetical protein
MRRELFRWIVTGNWLIMVAVAVAAFRHRGT